ncbi:TROVE domain-containing protein [Chitinophaga dinghuensis]|uniref:TROVE domain-containing protein n=1 Tax=Chitinophaga dinghuensis TaxID=1539050 RepID=A0A327W6H8_9BACT|nr:TROVE domain-containing protein [Chitinophaga dinghuensis]RAJ83624.1 TROVE domain-containing protein [Chitinophaga dinghuensis]
MKFNFLKRGTQLTTNHEGHTAFKLTPEMELYTTVVTASLSDQFYEKGTEKLDRIRHMMEQVDPSFIAKLAVYAREKMYMRSIPMVLAVELAKKHSGDNLVSQTVGRVVKRADEITELLAYYTMANERKETKKLHKLSKQVQKGLSTAFNRFDEYQFGKYDRKTAITLRDALFLVHPKAKDEAQQELFNRIAKQELATPYTWETQLSAAGQVKYATEEDKKRAFRGTWEALIESQELGYMAMMRNLRNMLEAEIGKEHIQDVCDVLSNPAAVRQSKQLPFRYLAAYRELREVQHGMTGKIMESLEAALHISIEHLKGFKSNTRVVIACDVSGSMQRPVSARSKVLAYDIGLMLGMMLQSKCEHVISGMFGDSWKVVNLPGKSILSNVDAFYKREGEVGYSTNAHLVLEDLIQRKYQADKIMFFTDCQMWSTQHSPTTNALKQAWTKYKQLFPAAKLYLFDLAGLGHSPLNIQENDVHLIAGWSDKVFEVMEAIDNGENALTHISAIQL